MKVPWLLLVKWSAILLLSESGKGHAAPPTFPRPETFQSLSSSDLDEAAGVAIQKLKSINPDGKVMVIGGAALQKYLPGYRSTMDVDIYQTVGSSLEIKKELLQDPRFYTRQTRTDNIDVTEKVYLFFQNSHGKNIEIDLPGKHVLSFEPTSAQVVKDVPVGTVPYISVEELIISKIESSLRRPEATKKELDIADAKQLLEKYPETTFTNDNHRQIVEKFRSEHNIPWRPRPKPEIVCRRAGSECVGEVTNPEKGVLTSEKEAGGVLSWGQGRNGAAKSHLLIALYQSFASENSPFHWLKDYERHAWTLHSVSDAKSAQQSTMYYISEDDHGQGLMGIKEDVNPADSDTVIARIYVGELHEGATIERLESALADVAVPVGEQGPASIEWVTNSLLHLQRTGVMAEGNPLLRLLQEASPSTSSMNQFWKPALEYAEDRYTDKYNRRLSPDALKELRSKVGEIKAITAGGNGWKVAESDETALALDPQSASAERFSTRIQLRQAPQTRLRLVLYNDMHFNRDKALQIWQDTRQSPFHWAVVSSESESMAPVTMYHVLRLAQPEGAFRYESRVGVSLLQQRTLLGSMDLGELQARGKQPLSAGQLAEMLDGVELPHMVESGTNCVTWACRAVSLLQREGYLPSSSSGIALDGVEAAGIEFGLDRLRAIEAAAGDATAQAEARLKTIKLNPEGKPAGDNSNMLCRRAGGGGCWETVASDDASSPPKAVGSGDGDGEVILASGKTAQAQVLPNARQESLEGMPKTPEGETAGPRPVGESPPFTNPADGPSVRPLAVESSATAMENHLLITLYESSAAAQDPMGFFLQDNERYMWTLDSVSDAKPLAQKSTIYSLYGDDGNQIPLEAKPNVDPAVSDKFRARVYVGKLKDGTTAADLKAELAKVTVPAGEQGPVTMEWVTNSLVQLKEAGYLVESSELLGHLPEANSKLSLEGLEEVWDPLFDYARVRSGERNVLGMSDKTSRELSYKIGEAKAITAGHGSSAAGWEVVASDERAVAVNPESPLAERVTRKNELMKMPQKHIWLALYNDQSLGHAQALEFWQDGKTPFHWAVLTSPTETLTEATMYHAILNFKTESGFAYQLRAGVDVPRQTKLVGLISLGELTPPLTASELDGQFQGVKLERGNNCVSWACRAVNLLQREGYLPSSSGGGLDLDRMEAAGVEFGLSRIQPIQDAAPAGSVAQASERIKVLRMNPDGTPSNAGSNMLCRRAGGGGCWEVTEFTEDLTALKPTDSSAGAGGSGTSPPVTENHLLISVYKSRSEVPVWEARNALDDSFTWALQSASDARGAEHATTYQLALDGEEARLGQDAYYLETVPDVNPLTDEMLVARVYVGELQGSLTSDGLKAALLDVELPGGKPGPATIAWVKSSLSHLMAKQHLPAIDLGGFEAPIQSYSIVRLARFEIAGPEALEALRYKVGELDNGGQGDGTWSVVESNTRMVMLHPNSPLGKEMAAELALKQALHGRLVLALYNYRDLTPAEASAALVAGDKDAFHWALLSSAADAADQSALYHALPVFDAGGMYAFTSRLSVNPALQPTLMARLDLGELTRPTSVEALIDALRGVEDSNSQLGTNCATWACRGVQRLQQKGILPALRVADAGMLEAVGMNYAHMQQQAIGKAETPLEAETVRLQIGRLRVEQMPPEQGGSGGNSLCRRAGGGGGCWGAVGVAEDSLALKPVESTSAVRGSADGSIVFTSIREVQGGRLVDSHQIALAGRPGQGAIGTTPGVATVPKPVVVVPELPTVPKQVARPGTGAGPVAVKPGPGAVVPSKGSPGVRFNRIYMERWLTNKFYRFGLAAELRFITANGDTIYAHLTKTLKVIPTLRTRLMLYYAKITRVYAVGSAIVAPFVFSSWIAIMASDQFREMSIEDKVAVGTMLIPIAGCISHHVAADAKGKGKDGGEIAATTVCLAADILLVTPAFPIGVILKLVEVMIRSFTSGGVNFELDELQKGLEENWNKALDKTMPKILDNMKNETYRRDTDTELKARMVMILYETSHIAAAIHDAETQRGTKPGDKMPEFPGDVPITMGLCRAYRAARAQIMAANEEAVQKSLVDSQIEMARSYMEQTIRAVGKARTTGATWGGLSGGGASTYKPIMDRTWDEGKRVYEKLKLPPTGFDGEMRRNFRKAMLEAITYKPDECRPTCQLRAGDNNSPSCLWTKCYPNQELTVQQMEKEGLVNAETKGHVTEDEDPYQNSCAEVHRLHCGGSYGAHLFDSILFPGNLVCTKPLTPEEDKMLEEINKPPTAAEEKMIEETIKQIDESE